LLRLDHHQVHVERERREAPDRLDDLGAVGEVRDETAVHDVDVDPVGAALDAHGDLVAQPGEVGAQEGWRNADGHRVPATLSVTLVRAATAEPAAGDCAITVPAGKMASAS